MKLIFTLLLIFVLLANAVYAEEIITTEDITKTTSDFEIENPKAVSEITVEITQSGSLTPIGDIKKANITLYIPQDAESISVVIEPSSGNWKISSDAFGNKILVIEFVDMKERTTYKVVSVLRSTASHLFSQAPIGSDALYLTETNYTAVNSDIIAAAYPFEKSLEKAADLAKFVYEYVDYDISLVGQRKPSTWVLQNRRGVCVEHTNLFIALLHANSIPARYVVGFAYSTVDQKMIGHTWAEVLVDQNKWVPFDPTWLQAGYLDATHIPTSRLLDDSQKDTLFYFGTGSVSWARNEDSLDVIDYKTESVGEITLSAERFAVNEAGYMKATLSANECNIYDIKITSCIDEHSAPLLDFKDPQRRLWSCSPVDVYWVYDNPGLEENMVYTCPVNVLEQSGAFSSYSIGIQGKSSPPFVSINGPDTVSINEIFTLSAEAPENFIFFSPEKGAYNSKTVSEYFGREGSYNFYLYSGGALAAKTVSVTKNRQFSAFASAPDHTKVNEKINMTIALKNLLPRPVRGNIKIVFDSAILYEGSYLFSSNEEKVMLFNVTAHSAGVKKLTASVFEDTIASYSVNVLVESEEKKKSIFDSIFSFFASIIDWFGNLL